MALLRRSPPRASGRSLLFASGRSLLFASALTACAHDRPTATGPDAQPPPPVLAPVHYDSGSDKLSFDDRPAVAQAVAELERNPELHLLLIGRTDSQGKADANMQLGIQRAHELRVAVLNKAAGKVKLERVHVGSRGQAEPTASNETEDGRKTNRRVEFFFYYPDGTPLKSRFPAPIVIEGE